MVISVKGLEKLKDLVHNGGICLAHLSGNVKCFFGDVPAFVDCHTLINNYERGITKCICEDWYVISPIAVLSARVRVGNKNIELFLFVEDAGASLSIISYIAVEFSSMTQSGQEVEFRNGSPGPPFLLRFSDNRTLATDYTIHSANLFNKGQVVLADIRKKIPRPAAIASYTFRAGSAATIFVVSYGLVEKGLVGGRVIIFTGTSVVYSMTFSCQHKVFFR